ncbi:MAG: hypothetical protein RL026_2499, partial [Pseudomonadota bacterium]
MNTLLPVAGIVSFLFLAACADP